MQDGQSLNPDNEFRPQIHPEYPVFYARVLCPNKIKRRIFRRSNAFDSDQKPWFDVNRERGMNSKLQRMLNCCDIRRLIEEIHPGLVSAWRLKDEVTDVRDENTVETAGKAWNGLIRNFFRSGIPEMIEYGKTLHSRKLEIIHSFIVIGYCLRLTDHGVISGQKRNTNMSENRSPTKNIPESIERLYQPARISKPLSLRFQTGCQAYAQSGSSKQDNPLISIAREISGFGGTRP